jgi:hypothetical protein
MSLFKASDLNLNVLLNHSDEFRNQDWLKMRSAEPHKNGPSLDDEIIQELELATFMEGFSAFEYSRKIKN